jgi:HK97 family phage portal protein
VSSLLGDLGRALSGVLAPVRNAAPVPYTSASGLPGYGSMLARGSMRAQMEAMGGVSTLFAVVSAITEAVIKPEWMLDRVSVNQSRVYGPVEPRRTPIVKHAALDLWNRPNDFYSRHDLLETSTQHLKLTGEAWWVLVADPRAPKLPIEMWPVRPDRMTPVPHPTEFISGYVYTAPDGEKVPLELDQVIQIKTPNPLDPYRGMGPVQALLADLDSARFSAEWNRRFFLNDATPGGVIEFDDNLGDAEFQRFLARWREQHQGVRNANRVALLEKAHWKDRQFNMRDMQFAELRGLSRDIIREAFRVHKAILGQSDDVNRANAEAADYQLAAWVVDPTLARFAGALNARLLPLFGTPVVTEFCYESPVPEDEKTEAEELTSRANAFKTLTEAGVHPDDAAAVVGLPPMRGQGSADGGGSAEAAAMVRNVVEMVQKVYLGVNVVLTDAEARDLLNRAGAGLPPGPLPTAPAPATPPTGLNGKRVVSV